MWPFVDPDVIQSNLHIFCDQNGPRSQQTKPDEVALTWALLALGQCYEARSHSSTTSSSAKEHMYSVACITNASVIINDQAYGRTLASVQTAMCIAQWLKVANCTSASHGYLSIAASAALRLGLHDLDAMADLPNNERKWYKRTIAALTAMDTLTSVSLGLPRILAASINGVLICDDPGHTLPTHQAHYEVTEILRRYFEPCFLSKSFKNGAIYQLPQKRVDFVVDELDSWKSRLGELFSAYDGTLTPRLVIELSYFFIQLLVYCPFIHYIGATSPFTSATTDYATKCVEAALQTVLIAEELQSRRMMISVHPFALDAVMLATTSLLLSEIRTRNFTQTTFDTSISSRAIRLLNALAGQSDPAKTGVAWIEKMKQDALKMAAESSSQSLLPGVSALLRFDDTNSATFGNTSLSPFSAAARAIDDDMPDASASNTPPATTSSDP
ncbi:hypothetical protein DOTSEDRAFT_73955 [Dothistroma septosporum NZE10]|uniref:Xylanolytic transcriptional activator regulatory domain-containing protein n=1 Tax=Dothistroma septosporum (strain NZE10 / CBS 128990) TaxID=675120 RepID=N1PHB8_DOTSN|nr:hypothetical protein DOTSEDRAFT_73955 [Dothistroma septosporum NZE10]